VLKLRASVFAALLAGAVIASGQNPPAQPQQQPPAQPQQQQQQQQPPQAGMQSVPATTTPEQPAGTRRPPQAKSAEEYQAYKAFLQVPLGPQAEAAGADFVTKFPQSELRSLLYQNLMDRYQATNNADKAIEMGRKAVAIDPDNTVILIMLADLLAERTTDQDVDHDARYAEAIKYAQHGLDTLNTGVVVPVNTPPEKVAALKQLLSAMAHAAIGFVELNRHNDAVAEDHLKQAAQLNVIQPDPMVYLRLAIAQDHQKKYQDAWQSANKAVELSPPGPGQELARQEKDRLEKLGATAPGTKPAAPPAATPPASAPPKGI
jgi:tetratricopeptide (TPR) repeat protein